MDIGEQTPAVDEEDGEEDGQNNGEEEAAAEMEEVQTDHPGEESAEEPNDEEEENVGDKDGKDTDSVEKNEEEVDEEKNGREAANEDVKIPMDEEPKAKVRDVQLSTDVSTPGWACVLMCPVLCRRELIRKQSCQSPLTGRSTTQTARLASRIFRAIQQWSWQGRWQRKTRPRRYGLGIVVPKA